MWILDLEFQISLFTLKLHTYVHTYSSVYIPVHNVFHMCYRHSYERT